ncbi:MAG: hypothetical protein RJA36_1415 [Pseudomonadota bacterium]|jgi:hypothetical protein
MTEFTVRWPDPPDGTLQAYGRNGSVKQTGVHVWDVGSYIIVRAISSRGHVSDAANLKLPAEPTKLIELATGLIAMANAMQAEQTAKRRNAAGASNSPGISDSSPSPALRVLGG